MKPQITLLIVANNSKWKTWPLKIKKLQEWFAPKLDLIVDIKHTAFNEIPFVQYQGHIAGTRGVEDGWYNQNITPLSLGYDMVMLVINTKQWDSIRARGWRTDRDAGAIELQTAADEKEFLIWPNFPSLSAFFQIARHEVCHALYMMTGQVDNTHKYWDEGKLEKVLAEIDLSTKVIIKQKYWLVSVFQRMLTNLLPKKQPMKLIDALIKVESGGDDYVDIMDSNGLRSYGCLCIQDPYIEDALGKEFKANQCIGNRPLSLQAFDGYMARYATPKRLGRPVTDEDRARIHNGGPSGWKRDSTKVYWIKVQKALANNK